MTWKNNIICCFKLCASFQYHHFVAICKFKLELQSWNSQIGAKFVLTSVTLTFHFWPRPFAWTSRLSMVITHINISGWYDDKNIVKQGKSEGFDSCDRPSNLTQIGFTSSIFQPVWPWNMMDDPKIQLGTSSMLASSIIRSHWWIQTGITVRKRLIWVKIDDFLCRVTLTFDGWPSKNNRAPLLCYFKLCAAFRSHWLIQTGVTVWKRLIWVKIDDFYKPCDLEIWRMTLKNNRAPLLCYFKLCVSFRSHWWIQTGVTIRKRPIWVKFEAF